MQSIKYTILKTLLNEGRLEDMVKRYSSELPKVWIEELSKNDPSGNNKYLEWMIKEVIRLEQETDDIEASVEKTSDAVKCFHENLNRLNEKSATSAFIDAGPKSVVERILKSPKDINVYSVESIDVLCQYFENIIPKNTSRIKIHEDDKYLVVTPLTHKASCQYGSHSNWCVSTSNDSYFHDYTKDGFLIFVIDKKGTNPKKPEANSYKFAIYIRFEDLNNREEWEFYDMEDKRFSSTLGLNLMNETVKEKIDNYVSDFAKNLEKQTVINLEELADNCVFFIEKELGENTTLEKSYTVVIDPLNQKQKNYFANKFKFSINDERLKDGFSILNIDKRRPGLPGRINESIYNWSNFLNFKTKGSNIDYDTVKKDFFNDFEMSYSVFFDRLQGATTEQINTLFDIVVNTFNSLNISKNEFVRPSDLMVGDTVIYRPGLRRYGQGVKLKVTRVAEKSIQLNDGRRVNKESYNRIEKVGTEPYKVVKKTQTNETRWIRKRIV